MVAKMVSSPTSPFLVLETDIKIFPSRSMCISCFHMFNALLTGKLEALRVVLHRVAFVDLKKAARDFKYR